MTPKTNNNDGKNISKTIAMAGMGFLLIAAAFTSNQQATNQQATNQQATNQQATNQQATNQQATNQQQAAEAKRHHTS
jgi:hypothetical protein